MPQSNQFNPLNEDNKDLSARQLTRAAQLAQQSVMSTGPDMMAGISGIHTRRSPKEPDVAWYKIISETGSGVYVVRRQTWKVSTKAFVDASGVDDLTAYEIDSRTSIAVGTFIFSQREFEIADAVVVMFSITGTKFLFKARIDQEDAGGGGEYDQWAEVESDTVSGGLKTKTGGLSHTTTGLSLWESNGEAGVAVGEFVTVFIQQGDNTLYLFEIGDGKVKVDAADERDYLENQMRGGTSPGTANEENLKVEKLNVAGNDDIMAIRHTTKGALCGSNTVTTGDGTQIHFDANGHYHSHTAAP